MISNRRHSLLTLLVLAAALFVSGCSQEEGITQDNGVLHLGLGYTTSVAETRATPAQLGKPLVEKFNLRVECNGKVYYDDKFVEELELRVGSYNITAYHGENVVIGKDAPYYEGTAVAEIEKGASSSVTIPCRVANALVSIVFGRDETERARFDRFYSRYGVLVRVGNHSQGITEEDINSSVYFPAGSQPTLFFYGILRDNDEVVSLELQSADLPTTFEAADHATVTLNLPDPESAVGLVDIAKVEVETVTIEETIPLSWLPAPMATAQHRYDAAGYLQGTDVEFSNSYPGMQWRAVVTNANDQMVRSIEGMGVLQTTYDNSTEYPYLPSGDYMATYYVIDGESVEKVSSRAFSVGKPDLKLTVSGYTSYTKYQEGDVDGANKCDGKSVYDLSVSLNVAETVLAKNEYTFTFRYGSGYTENVEAGKNRFYRDVVANQTASFEPYRLEANVTFDGVSLSGAKDFYITGLPATYEPPTASHWTTTGSVSFSGSEAKLNGNNAAITNAGFAIPSQTKVTMDYNVKVRAGAWATNKFTIALGSANVVSQSLTGGLLSEKTSSYSDSKVSTTTSQTTTIKCTSSKQYTSIYSLSLKYSK